MIEFRPVVKEDLPHIGEAIEAEPTHKDLYTAPFFFVGDSSCFCCTKVCDEEGPVIYLRIQKPDENNLVFLLPQFIADSRGARRRIARAFLMAFKPLLKSIQDATNAKGIVVETKSPPLVKMLTLRFGFEESGEDKYQFLFGAN